jgi:hypothetical protein
MSDDHVRFRIRERGNCSLEELKRAAVVLRNEMLGELWGEAATMADELRRQIEAEK